MTRNINEKRIVLIMFKTLKEIYIWYNNKFLSPGLEQSLCVEIEHICWRETDPLNCHCKVVQNNSKTWNCQINKKCILEILTILTGLYGNWRKLWFITVHEQVCDERGAVYILINTYNQLLYSIDEYLLSQFLSSH